MAQLISDSNHDKLPISLRDAGPSSLRASPVGLKLRRPQLNTNLLFLPLPHQPLLFLPNFPASGNDQSSAEASSYLVDKNAVEQKILLRLPKVDVGRIMISIYSTSGNLLMKKSVRNQEESSMVMDLKQLQAGAYLMEIQAAEIYEKFSFMLD